MSRTFDPTSIVDQNLAPPRENGGGAMSFITDRMALSPDRLGQSPQELRDAVSKTISELSCAPFSNGRPHIDEMDQGRLKGALYEALDKVTTLDGSKLYPTPDSVARAADSMFNRLVDATAKHEQEMQPGVLSRLAGASLDKTEFCAPVKETRAQERIDLQFGR